MILPPLEDSKAEALRRRISLVPVRHREDAIQEAWGAHLSGDCPMKAVARFKTSELKRERRFPTFTDAKAPDAILSTSQVSAPSRDKKRRPITSAA